MKALLPVCFLLGVLSGAFAQDALLQARVSPLPGSYQAPVRLGVEVPPGASVRYRFLETPVAATFPWTGELILDSLPGESRPYGLRITTDLPTGETMTRDYRYLVTRPANPLATVQPEPGRYTSAVTVKPDLPPGWSILENGRPSAFPRTLDVEPGRTGVFSFQASGPAGELFLWTFTVDRRDQEAQGLELVSPRTGEWANLQPLVAIFRGVDKVLWSYGETLDTAQAQEYSGPVLLERPGRQSVTVAARSRSDGSWLERTVSWDNGAAVLPGKDWPASGVVEKGLSLPIVPGHQLSWDEGRSWQASTAVLEPPSSSRKVLSLLVKKEGTPFRFVYWLDSRVPDGPAVEFSGGWNPRVYFTGSPEAAHRIVWTKADGTSVEEPGQLWGPVGSWKVPDAVVAARVVAVGTNRLAGPPTSLGFSETGWSTPGWEPWDQRGPLADATQLPLGGRVPPRPGFWPVYSVSDRPDVAEPGTGSPLLTGAFLPVFPWGSDRTLYVRFAWRDAGGLVGPGSPAVAVRVDRVPPSAPEIQTVGGQVLVKAAEGEEEGNTLVWAVTSGRVSSADALTFQPYQTALDLDGLRSGAGGNLWFHAQAQDRAGNTGLARLNVALSPDAGLGSAVQVDSDPAIGEIPVENGGVYPWPTFRLRALDEGRDLWVGVSDQGSVPGDWRSRVQPWSGILSRGIARGERRTFLVYWNAKTAGGWEWAQPQTLSLTLDLSAPAAPVVDPWPAAPLGGSWTLGMKPGRTGDTLRYSYTLNGQLPPDPREAGEPWPGSRTWDAPAGGKVQVRVRLAAVSVSGWAVEVPLGDAVTIDRSPPAPVIPQLEPFTYRTAPFAVPLPPGARVRYTITTDGQLPGVPTESSPLVPAAGLLLEGRGGESVLYRFRWRSFSLAGAPGLVAGPYGVLIDQTASTVQNGQEAEVEVPSPRLTGIPDSGISASAVTLTAAGPSGVYRFEVREGLGQPRPVTAQSPLWEAPLVLDGGPGVDRPFAVGIRGFSPEGRPVTEEVTYSVRVDRSVPGTPAVELAADPRRPEAVVRNLAPAANPDETLYYRWSWESFPQGQGESGWAVLTTPAVFAAPGGALTRLRLEAYLKDAAGNQGPAVEKRILIDQNVVYVALEGTGDGSRSRPLGRVEEALDAARREGKSILLVTAGSYPVSRTLDLGGLQVFGGLDADWEAAVHPGRSVWTAVLPFEGTVLIESEERTWTLTDVDLTTGGVLLSRAVSVRGGGATVRNSAWTWAGASRGWSQQGGTLSWSEVTTGYTAQAQGIFLELDGVEASVRGLRLAATQNQGGLIVSMKDSTALFRDLVMVSKSSRGFDGLWSVSRSRLTVDEARVQGGDGADRATGFLLRDSETTLWNTEISLYGALANTGFQTDGGRLEVRKSSLSLQKGNEYNQGFVLDRSETILQSLDLTIEAGAYQGGFSVDRGTLKFSSGQVSLAGGGQRVWGAQFLSESTVVLEDLRWILRTKTPGELWKQEKPWTKDSSVRGTQTTGW